MKPANDFGERKEKQITIDTNIKEEFNSHI